jgi:hypothetical protein
MRNYDRLSILVSIILLGLALMLVIRLPGWVIQADLLGSPITIVLSTRLIMTLLLSALTAAGVHYIMRDHAAYEAAETGRITGYSVSFWILPTLVTMAAAWLTPGLYFTSLFLWLGGLAVTGILLSAVIFAEYHTIERRHSLYIPARLFLNLVTYGSSLILFSVIYGAKLRSLLSASTVAFLATVLALALLRVDRDGTGRTLIYAAICGLLLGEATWALNYWGVGGIAGGALLVLIFYFFTGLAQQRLLNRFGRPILIEYGLVGSVALIVLASQGALSW